MSVCRLTAAICQFVGLRLFVRRLGAPPPPPTGARAVGVLSVGSTSAVNFLPFLFCYVVFCCYICPVRRRTRCARGGRGGAVALFFIRPSLPFRLPFCLPCIGVFLPIYAVCRLPFRLPFCLPCRSNFKKHLTLSLPPVWGVPLSAEIKQTLITTKQPSRQRRTLFCLPLSSCRLFSLDCLKFPPLDSGIDKPNKRTNQQKRTNKTKNNTHTYTGCLLLWVR